MYADLKGKIALVTGATRGFGRGIALKLASQGVTVIVNYRRSMTEAQQVVDEIRKLGGEAISIRADIGKEEKIIEMFRVIKATYGRLDILVANASFGIPGKLLEATSRHWDITMDSTAKSLLLLTQSALPLMTDGGHIVSLTSYGGQKVLDGYGVVGPSKAAVEALTRTLAIECATKGIQINGVMPGLSDTKSLRAIPGAESYLEMIEKRTPAGRLVSPEEVANVVAFLCSEQSKMIMGQFIIIDGGCYLV